MTFRKWRIAFSAIAVVGCVMLGALWLRSFWTMDALCARSTGAGSIVVVSILGEIELRSDQTATDIAPPPMSLYTGQIWHDQLDDSYRLWFEPEFAGFSFRSAKLADLEIDIPYWFIIVLAGALGIAPWLSRRFSLRTLLLTATTIAIGLGMLLLLENPHIGFLRPGHPSLPELRGN